MNLCFPVEFLKCEVSLYWWKPKANKKPAPFTRRSGRVAERRVPASAVLARPRHPAAPQTGSFPPRDQRCYLQGPFVAPGAFTTVSSVPGTASGPRVCRGAPWAAHGPLSLGGGRGLGVQFPPGQPHTAVGGSGVGPRFGGPVMDRGSLAPPSPPGQVGTLVSKEVDSCPGHAWCRC